MGSFQSPPQQVRQERLGLSDPRLDILWLCSCLNAVEVSGKGYEHDVITLDALEFNVFLLLCSHFQCHLLCIITVGSSHVHMFDG